MTPDRRYPERVPRRYTGTARDARAARQSRYSVRRPLQSTRAVTVKLSLLAVVATLAIGGLIAAQMAAGNDPSLGPKAATRAKKAGAKSSTSGSSTGTSSGSSSSSTDPYSQAYGGDYYGSSSGYSSGSSSSGSSGYSSGSGYSTQQSAPPPVTSSTS
jgi:hypothetical protein